MRFISLLHPTYSPEPQVLKQGDVAIDPIRTIKISVVDDHVVNRPLVCRVRIEWAQNISDDKNGAFDLSIEPWDGNYQTPDIWIDRLPYGDYDQTNDFEGRPQGNGDRPRPNEINKFWGRIKNQGAIDATDVRVTFYAIQPPGVGDNGNWTSLQTKTIPSIDVNDSEDVTINWVPVIGEQTCLKVFAEQQLGEVI